MKLGTKQKQQQLVLIRVGIVVLFVLCVLVLFSVVKRYQIASDMADRRTVVENEKVNLIERKEQLEERVQYLEDDRSVEAEIRRNFDVAKEGEQVVVILDKEEPREEAPEVEPVVATPWYIFWR